MCLAGLGRFDRVSRADPYSQRSATRGSVRDARKAGRYDATNATAVSKAATAAKVIGSVASTPYSNDDMRRVSPMAETSP